MNRQEQVRAFAVGDRRALLERDEVVGAAGQDDLDAGNLLEQLLETQRDVEHELRFAHALALGAGIVAAVPGIDHDPRDAEAELTRHREAAGSSRLGPSGHLRAGRDGRQPTRRDRPGLTCSPRV